MQAIRKGGVGKEAEKALPSWVDDEWQKSYSPTKSCFQDREGKSPKESGLLLWWELDLSIGTDAAIAHGTQHLIHWSLNC